MRGDIRGNLKQISFIYLKSLIEMYFTQQLIETFDCTQYKKNRHFLKLWNNQYTLPNILSSFYYIKW